MNAIEWSLFLGMVGLYLVLPEPSVMISCNDSVEVVEVPDFHVVDDYQSISKVESVVVVESELKDIKLVP